MRSLSVVCRVSSLNSILAPAMALLLVGGCSSGGVTEGEGGSASGGTTSTGGVTGAGGTTGSGGTAGTGGVLGTGGAPGTGGTRGSGGTPGTGGEHGSGGTPGTGGEHGSGGTPGAGGTPGTGGAHGSGGTPGSGGTATGSGGMSNKGGAPGTGGGTGQGGVGGTTTGTGTSATCTVGTPLSGGSQHCSSNATGNVGSFSYSIWSSGSGGCITTYGVGAAYKATWSNAGDFLAGCGFQWNETQTYDQYGTVSADYAYTKTGSAGGYSYIGIYGWSNNPLIEFYVVDDWFGTSPPTGGGTLKGTFTVDGGTYKVYQHQQTNQPSIHGTTTFQQYFSVRQTARQCGHISLTEHFKEWASLSMPLGKMASARLLTEAGGGSGSVDYSSATMTAAK